MLYRVVGKSMEPNYGDGCFVWISKRTQLIKAGDVVLALDPRDGRPILKRVQSITKEGIYLLGDNGLESTDSRTFGLVEKENIIGRVIMKLPSSRKGKITSAIVVLALVGLVDATYLTVKHITGGKVSCGVIPGLDCDIVLGSVYSEVFGIPLALLGALYYVSVFILGAICLRHSKSMLFELLFGLTSLGLITSLYLIYIQAFILNAYCLFCMVSAFISISIFSMAACIIFGKENKTDVLKNG